jgi:hypothetical protein
VCIDFFCGIFKKNSDSIYIPLNSTPDNNIHQTPNNNIHQTPDNNIHQTPDNNIHQTSDETYVEIPLDQQSNSTYGSINNNTKPKNTSSYINIFYFLAKKYEFITIDVNKSSLK